MFGNALSSDFCFPKNYKIPLNHASYGATPKVVYEERIGLQREMEENVGLQQ